MRAIKLFPLVLIPLLLTGACQKEKKENHPPKILRIKFSPSPPLPGNDLRAVVETQDPDGDVIRIKYHWYVNGKLVQKGKSSVLPGNLLGKNAEVYVEVQANDGINFTDWIRSQTVSVKSGGEMILQVKIEPSQPFNDSILKAKVNCLECPGMIFHYQWEINRKPIDYDAPELDGKVMELKPGDRVQVKVWRETSPNEFYYSPEVVIINRAPQFSDQGKAWIEDGIFHLQVRAKDPDGEPITYQLLSAPAGASFNPRTRTLSWAIPEGFEGRVELKISASDPSGLKSIFTGSFQIQGGKIY